MGAAFSWFAVGIRPAAAVLKQMFLRDTGTPVQGGIGKIAGTVLPNGWYVVVTDEFWHPLIHPNRMSPLSEECLVVGCSENASVNTSLAFCYGESQFKWRVSHILDEGYDHLAIEGNPPQSTKTQLAQAKKDGLQKKYDAVFGVPASLAQQICGFRYLDHSGFRFTELIPVGLVSLPQVVHALRTRLVPMLAARGFVQQSSSDDCQSFVAKTDQDDVRVDVEHWAYPNGGCGANIRFAVCNHAVQALSTCVPDYGHRLTYKRSFSDVVRLSGGIDTPEDLSQWVATMDAKLPAILDNLRSIRGLDALANDGSPRYGFYGDPTLSHYDTETGLSRIVLAYLAGNPGFARMVAETDAAYTGGASPTNDVHAVVAYLKAHAKPVA